MISVSAKILRVATSLNILETRRKEAGSLVSFAMSNSLMLPAGQRSKSNDPDLAMIGKVC